MNFPSQAPALALPHARPLDIIDLAPLGPGPAGAVMTSLLKADGVQMTQR